MPAPYPRSFRTAAATLNRQPIHRPDDPPVRTYVRARGADACEYCLMPTNGRFEIEHIVPKAQWSDYQANDYAALRPPRRLAAPTFDHISNFAWSCFFCNRYKGGQRRPRGTTRLYDPRHDTWPRHFGYSPTKGYMVIVGLTEIGRETIRSLKFHEGGEEGPVVERGAMVVRGLYPPLWLRAAYRI